MHRRQDVVLVHGTRIVLVYHAWIEREGGGHEIHRVRRKALAEQLGELRVVEDFVAGDHFAQRVDVVLRQSECFDFRELLREGEARNGFAQHLQLFVQALHTVAFASVGFDATNFESSDTRRRHLFLLRAALLRQLGFGRDEGH